MMTSEDSHMLFEGLLKYTINFLFHKLILNTRVGHRSRLNIFDVVKVISSLSISHNELRIYLKWLRQNAEACGLIYSIFPKNQIEYFNNCKLDLVFCVDVNETKKPGFDYFPPTPSSFTFKFTPVFGKLEEEALSILTRKTEEKLKVENNLFASIASKEPLLFVNYDDI